MKKVFVFGFFVLTFTLAASNASAQEGSVTTSADTATTVTSPVIPSDSSVVSPQTPLRSSGATEGQAGSPRVIQGQAGGNVGDEVSRLQREMEEKIRAIRAEYKIKIDVARKAASAVRQNVRQNARQNIKQNVKQQRQNLQSQRQDLQQNARQNARENVRQNINGLLPPGSQQQNPIGPTQEQLGPSPSSGPSAPVPFSSSILEKFLPSYGW